MTRYFSRSISPVIKLWLFWLSIIPSIYFVIWIVETCAPQNVQTSITIWSGLVWIFCFFTWFLSWPDLFGRTLFPDNLFTDLCGLVSIIGFLTFALKAVL